MVLVQRLARLLGCRYQPYQQLAHLERSLTNQMVPIKPLGKKKKMDSLLIFTWLNTIETIIRLIFHRLLLLYVSISFQKRFPEVDVVEWFWASLTDEVSIIMSRVNLLTNHHTGLYKWNEQAHSVNHLYI